MDSSIIPLGKYCSKCDITKPFDAFSKNKNRKDGLDSYCKDCRNESFKKNKKQWGVTAAQWREKNREVVRENSRRYYIKNKDTVLQKRAIHRKENMELYRVKVRRYKARKKNAIGVHTADDVSCQYKKQNGKCFYCGCEVGDKYHVDHVIPLSRGGSNGPENLVIACPPCNFSKNRKTPDEWQRANGDEFHR